MFTLVLLDLSMLFWGQLYSVSAPPLTGSRGDRSLAHPLKVWKRKVSTRATIKLVVIESQQGGIINKRRTHWVTVSKLDRRVGGAEKEDLTKYYKACIPDSWYPNTVLRKCKEPSPCQHSPLIASAYSCPTASVAHYPRYPL
jgi:hypothetical protein